MSEKDRQTDRDRPMETEGMMTEQRKKMEDKEKRL